MATRYNAGFAVLYVQTSREAPDRIPLANQRYLINHFKLATDLRGEVIQVQSDHVVDSIIDVCRKYQISTVCVGKPSFKWTSLLKSVIHYRKLLNGLARLNIDLIILAQNRRYEN